MEEKDRLVEDRYEDRLDLEPVSHFLEQLSVYVVQWSNITTWPENEIWMLMVVVSMVTLVAVVAVPVLLLKWLIQAPVTYPDHCHQCAVHSRRVWAVRRRRIGAWIGSLPDRIAELPELAASKKRRPLSLLPSALAYLIATVVGLGIPILIWFWINNV